MIIPYLVIFFCLQCLFLFGLFYNMFIKEESKQLHSSIDILLEIEAGI